MHLEIRIYLGKGSVIIFYATQEKGSGEAQIHCGGGDNLQLLRLVSYALDFFLQHELAGITAHSRSTWCDHQVLVKKKKSRC